MGLLDDAIREHLDLKRARGGDPAEIEKMEREALGPVRREPTLGSTRFEAADEHAPPAPETGYPDDRAELLSPGYHDSTAPHPHAHHDHPYHDEADHFAGSEHGDPFGHDAGEPEQPRRRFLRRNRPSSPVESEFPEPGFHEQPGVDPHGLLEHDGLLEHHDPLGHHDVVEHHDQLEHHDPLSHQDLAQYHETQEHHESLAQHHETQEHHESLAHHDLHAQQESEEPAAPSTPPPHLQFDHPPKRPRFSPEPPALHGDQGDEPPTGGAESASAAPAPPAESAREEDVEIQETTEFDVQKHIAETRFQPDPVTRVQPSRPEPSGDQAPDDEAPAEDVLEETPEFLQDTPEHDRLWFEQRPPRDFDFDG